MKQYFSYLLPCFLAIALMACEDDSSAEPSTDGAERGYFYQQAQLEEISANSSLHPVAGDKVVFEYRYAYPDDPGIADDEFSDVLLWEVPISSSSFTITDMKASNAFYYMDCYCSIKPSNDITGRISGKKINASSWKIELDVTVNTSTGYKRIHSNKTFILQPLE